MLLSHHTPHQESYVIRMGSQSTTIPFRHRSRLLWVLLLIALHSFAGSAQSTVSATAVPLLLPSAIVFDQQGNLYVAETGNHAIRKIDRSGNITTIAGTGIQGFAGDGGLAAAAKFDSPQGLAIDAAGDLYIADSHNHRIRRIDAATQVIITIAGTGVAGFAGDGGAAAMAQLDLPTALAIDSGNNLYLADSANHRIRRVDTSGNITTIAGAGTQGFSGDNGLATAASIDSPNGLAIDATGNLYLADTHNQRIRRIDATTYRITTFIGTGAFGFSGDGTTSAALALPQGISLDSSGNLYFADSANHRIRRIDALTGQITTIAGTGTQGFSGDNGPAVAANLDSPRATALSANPPAALVTLADTGNQRIRQLEPAPSSAAVIQTLGGLGQTAPGTLTLTASSVIAYGTGSITASLAAGTVATGNITLLDMTAIGTITLATIKLDHDAAVFSTATLPAGLHNITASYSGDATHLAAQSQALALTVSPQPLQADATSITLLYGQPVPAIQGTLTGVLPQDSGSVTGVFTTTANNLSPPGAYPIAASISGPAAGNYTVTNSTASLTIKPAPSQTTLAVSESSISAGLAVALKIQVATTTSGTPTGIVTLNDGATPVATGSIAASGVFAFNSNSFAVGTHNLIASYPGDVNFLGSSSTPLLLTVQSGSPVSPDFTLAATGVVTQTVVSGSPASFTFTAQTQGNFNSAVNLTASGLPVGATASFNPASIPPGATNPTATLTIITASTQAQSESRRIAPATLALLLILPLTGLTRRRSGHTLFVALLIFLSTAVIGCGDRIAANAQSTLPIATYAITVTGTATGPTGAILTHSTVVTLAVQPSQ